MDHIEEKKYEAAAALDLWSYGAPNAATSFFAKHRNLRP